MIRQRTGAENRALKNAEFEREALPHTDALYRYALGFALDSAQAEDWVQEALLKAYRGWRSYELGTNVRGWLLTILRNTIISHHRRRSRIDLISPTDEEHYRRRDDLVLDPEGQVMRALVSERVRAAISRLPPHFREAVMLSDIEGMSYGEIAEVTGVPIGTVKSRIFRGRRILQEQLYTYAVRMGYIEPASPHSWD